MEFRFYFFIAALSLFTFLEFLFPRRKESFHRKQRWTTHFGLIFVGNVFIKFLFPLTALEWSSYLQKTSFGFFNLIELPQSLEIFLCVVFLDLIVYYQHLLFHRIPFLWRFHLVHHTDMNLDASSAIRFHPIEIYVSFLIKILFISLLGVDPLAVLIFEIILNTCAMFNHANLNLSKRVDQFLVKFLVTPDFHRIHHSQIPLQMHSNFGFNISLWDILFKTAQFIPYEKQCEIILGISEENKKGIQHFWDLFVSPFKKIKNEKTL